MPRQRVLLEHHGRDALADDFVEHADDDAGSLIGD